MLQCTTSIDTLQKHIICRAIIEHKGRVTADDVAKVLVKTDPDDTWLSVFIAQERVKIGVPAREAGLRDVPCDDAAMSISPVGIINAGNPQQASWDAYDVASLFQTGYSRMAACSVAAAIAEAMAPRSTIASIIDASMKYTDEINKKYIRQAINLAAKYKDVSRFTPAAYKHLLVDWHMWPHPLDPKKEKKRSFSADPLEVVPIALAIFYIAKGNPKKAILGGANFGRDCDTIAGIAGSLAGAYKGANSIPINWMETVQEANPETDIKKLALGIVKAIENTVNQMEKQIKLIQILKKRK